MGFCFYLLCVSYSVSVSECLLKDFGYALFWWWWVVERGVASLCTCVLFSCCLSSVACLSMLYVSVFLVFFLLWVARLYAFFLLPLRNLLLYFRLDSSILLLFLLFLPLALSPQCRSRPDLGFLLSPLVSVKCLVFL